MLVTDPEEGRDHVDLRSRLGRNMTWSKGQVQILNEEKDIGGKFDSLPKMGGGSVFASNCDQEGGNLRTVSVPNRDRRNGYKNLNVICESEIERAYQNKHIKG